jgi:hypothetical protein
MDENRTMGPRECVLPELGAKFTPQTPLQLPLKGEMTVIGNTDWKPFKSFFLDTGFWFVDGVYRILEVTHTLSNEGFFTKITFQWN